MTTDTLTAQLQKEARAETRKQVFEQYDKLLDRASLEVTCLYWNKRTDTLIATAVQRAREEAVKPYIESIKQIAQRLRNGGLLKTAQKIEDDLATLQTNH